MDVSAVEKDQYGTQNVEITKTHSMTGWNEIDLSGGNQLERGLKSRHIQVR
jgi:amino acid transporter